MVFGRNVICSALLSFLPLGCSTTSNQAPPADAGPPEVEASVDAAAGTFGPPYLDGPCDPIAPAHCGLPFPSNAWMKADATSPTGLRVAFGAGTLPAINKTGPHMSPSYYADLDGFSPSQAPFTHLVGATLTGLPTLATPAASITPSSPTVLMEAETGALVPHFVELDASGDATHDDQRVLLIRPTVRLKDATRYVVAIRRVVDKAGTAIAPSPAFLALRDGSSSTEASVGLRRNVYRDIFGRLTKAGIDQASLQIAWDYTTASDKSLTSTLIAMRDDAFTKVGAAGPAYTITKTTDAPSPHILRQIEGTFTVPLYLDKAVPGGKLVRDASGAPKASGTAEFPFIVYIPNSVTTQGPAPLLQNGHGLLENHTQGGHLEVGDDYLSVIADTKNYVVFAVDWSGLAASDQSYLFDLFNGDLGKFHNVIDRSHQGILNALLAMRMMMGSFFKDPAAQVNGKSAIDPAQRFYRGDSQGGILGTTYMALSPDVSRGLLGMTGMGYDLMLQRSLDFSPFFALLAASYPDLRDQQIIVGLVAMMWDRIEGTAFAPHVLASPLTAVAAKQVLVHVAIGDYQVPSIAGQTLARTLGVKSMKKAPRTIFQLEEVDAPYAGSGLVEWDFGVPDTLTNVPSTADPKLDPHSKVRTLPASHTQTDIFFRTGKIDMSPCSGGPCKG